MSQLPEKWYVTDYGCDQEYDADAGDDGRTIGYPTHQIKAIPDMLEALEGVMGELDVEGLPCPMCGGSAASGHKHNCLWHVVNAAIRKAWGEE